MIFKSRLYSNFRDELLKNGVLKTGANSIILEIFEVCERNELTFDEVKGVYLAFWQMAKKNKIANEDFRRQLGSRIPNVFGVMAKTVGVSKNKLSSMIINGELISCDVLPSFIENLNKELCKKY